MNWLRFIGSTLLFSGFAILVWHNLDGLQARVNRPVTRVTIAQQWQGIDAAEVQKLLAGYLGAGFFDFPVQEVRQALENHPWIRRAVVKKVWPDSVWLTLTEEMAIARWGEDRLLNQHGGTFKPATMDQLSGLPRLDGPQETQMEVMRQFDVMDRLFHDAGLRVTGLTLSQRGNWVLELNDRIQVTVGRTEIISRLQRFLDFYHRQSAGLWSDTLSVDLRYDNGIAIKSKTRVLSARERMSAICQGNDCRLAAEPEEGESRS